MLICMKPNRKEIEALAERLSAARTSKKLSRAEIGRLAGVHASQVGRILVGQFRTISLNVVQVCRVLEIDLDDLGIQAIKNSPAWLQLEQGIRNLWDETPHGANLIVRLLGAIADLRSNQLNSK